MVSPAGGLWNGGGRGCPHMDLVRGGSQRNLGRRSGVRPPTEMPGEERLGAARKRVYHDPDKYIYLYVYVSLHLIKSQICLPIGNEVCALIS